jgi:hypothetical protein
MKPADLIHGATVEYRTGRGGETAPAWREWRTGTLYVRRRVKDLKERGRVVSRAGEIVELALVDAGWATYTERDYDPTYDVWLNEDYYLQLRLPGGGSA